MALTERQQHILKIVITEYINSGQPIGSKTIVDNHNIGVSSATVRNEMADLEEQGYLVQPHTSAGRTPTETGYRYFVEKLMDETTLSADEKLMIRHQFHQVRLELDQWMRLSAAVLAHSTRSASLVTSPKINSSKLKHIELISIHERVILLVLVLQEGTVKQQIMNVAIPYTQDQLRLISHQLTDLWSNFGVIEITAASSALIGLTAEVALVVIETITRINARKTSDMYYDGLLNMLREANLSESSVLQQVVHILEEQRIVEQLVGQALAQQGVQIIIGGDDRFDDNLSQVSIVLSSYGTESGLSGALGVVGPTRMSYGRAVSIVQYMSHLMSDLMVDLYGTQSF